MLLSQSQEIKNKNLQYFGITLEGTSIVKHMVDWSHSNIDNSKKSSIFEITPCEI